MASASVAGDIVSRGESPGWPASRADVPATAPPTTVAVTTDVSPAPAHHERRAEPRKLTHPPGPMVTVGLGPILAASYRETDCGHSRTQSQAGEDHPLQIHGRLPCDIVLTDDVATGQAPCTPLDGNEARRRHVV